MGYIMVIWSKVEGCDEQMDGGVKVEVGWGSLGDMGQGGGM